MRELPRPRDDADLKVLSDIASHGWHVIKVQGADELPGWAFSMGLYRSYGHPEVVLFGLPLERMHAIINVIGDLVTSGARLHGGAVSDEVLEGYRCAFIEVDRRWYRPFFGYALWLYRGDEFPVTQCCWPDRDDHLPSDPRCSGAVSSRQPRLDLETEEAAGVTELLRSMERDAQQGVAAHKARGAGCQLLARPSARVQVARVLRAGVATCNVRVGPCS